MLWQRCGGGGGSTTLAPASRPVEMAAPVVHSGHFSPAQEERRRRQVVGSSAIGWAVSVVPPPQQGGEPSQAPAAVGSAPSIDSTSPPLAHVSRVPQAVPDSAAQELPVRRELEDRVHELERELLRCTKELEGKDRALDERAREISSLLERVWESDAELLRLMTVSLASRPPPAGVMANPSRVGQLEEHSSTSFSATPQAENKFLRARLDELDAAERPLQTESGVLPAPGADSSPDATRRERAARRLQQAARPWVSRVRQRHADNGSNARDRWKQTLQDVEVAVGRALENAVGQDCSRVPRLTRLQVLGQKLKQAVFKVNEAMMKETLKDLRKPAHLAPRSPVSGSSISCVSSSPAENEPLLV